MGKFFGNLKIKQKLLFAFTMLMLLTTIMGSFAVFSQIKTNRTLMKLDSNEIVPLGMVIDTYVSFRDARFLALKAVTFAGSESTDKAGREKMVADYEATIDLLNKNIDALIEYNNSDPTVTLDMESINELDRLVNEEYVPTVGKMMDTVVEGDYEGAILGLSEGAAVAGEVQDIVASLLAGQLLEVNTVIDEITTRGTRTNVVLCILLIIAIILSFGIALLVSNDLSKKINALARTIKDVSKGKLDNVSVYNTADEIGQLSRDVALCVDTIQMMVSDAKEMGDRISKGEYSYKSDLTKYEGQYSEMMNSVNNCLYGLIDETMDFLNVLTNVAGGDFTGDVPRLPGDKVAVNNCLDLLKANLSSLNTEIQTVVKEASMGNLSYRSDVEVFEGEWKVILGGLNDLLETVALPINATQDVLNEMANGNLSARIEGEYYGDFAAIKNSANNSMATIANYIRIIGEVLGAINDNDLTRSIYSEFVGDFDNLKVAINDIIIKLNEVFKEFLVGADEVAVGAQQISNSSISLADGAAEQVSSLTSLTHGVQKVSESSSQNAESASRANQISEVSKQNAVTGDEQMKQMLVSMDEISQSSNEISNIIKVIEDIAFQTNLLALNAAVEAARAGAHGKGFAVVADEVRTLAARSSQAAKETTELIQTSISRVAYGSELAKSTADALDQIVNNVTDVANIIDEISVSSIEQAKSVDQINDEIRIVENVVLKTSAASEEGVSTAEELSSQSTVLRDLIGTFKLRN